MPTSTRTLTPVAYAIIASSDGLVVGIDRRSRTQAEQRARNMCEVAKDYSHTRYTVAPLYRDDQRIGVQIMQGWANCAVGYIDLDKCACVGH